MKPVIGITMGVSQSPRSENPHSRYHLDRSYVDRVIDAGGVPVLIPPGADADRIAPLLDGLIIPGGNDLDPSLWGDAVHPEVELEYSGRTQTELALLGQVSESVPILGICYGCQLINVMRGGSLHQHMPDHLGHDGHRGDPIQNYRVELDSKLGEMVGGSASGKSWHHQSVDRLGDSLRVTAWHEDGTVEAIEDTSGRWVVAVQWHPERSDVVDSKKIFAAFMAAVNERRQAKS
jgi:putative glutamine amidotransferase